MKKPEVKMVTVKWFCAKCWQEGECVVEYAVSLKELGKIPDVQMQHNQRLWGTGSTCKGEYRTPRKRIAPRLKRTTAPRFNFPGDGETLK